MINNEHNVLRGVIIALGFIGTMITFIGFMVALSGGSIVLPGLGLVVSGGFVLVIGLLILGGAAALDASIARKRLQ